MIPRLLSWSPRPPADSDSPLLRMGNTPPVEILWSSRIPSRGDSKWYGRECNATGFKAYAQPSERARALHWRAVSSAGQRPLKNTGRVGQLVRV